jgi:hypothetical protein
MARIATDFAGSLLQGATTEQALAALSQEQPSPPAESAPAQIQDEYKGEQSSLLADARGLLAQAGGSFPGASDFVDTGRIADDDVVNLQAQGDALQARFNQGPARVTVDEFGRVVRTPGAADPQANISADPATAQSPDAEQASVGAQFDPQLGQCQPICPESCKQKPDRIKKRRIIRQGKLEAIELTLKLGSMLFRPQQNTILDGTGKVVDGEYRVTKVRHKWTTGVPFETWLSMARGFFRPKPPRPPCVCIPGEQSRANPNSGTTEADVAGQGGATGSGTRGARVRIGEFGAVTRSEG